MYNRRPSSLNRLQFRGDAFWVVGDDPVNEGVRRVQRLRVHQRSVDDCRAQPFVESGVEPGTGCDSPGEYPDHESSQDQKKRGNVQTGTGATGSKEHPVE